LLRKPIQVIIETKCMDVPYVGGSRGIDYSRPEPKAEQEKTA